MAEIEEVHASAAQKDGISDVYHLEDRTGGCYEGRRRRVVWQDIADGVQDFSGESRIEVGSVENVGPVHKNVAADERIRVRRRW